MYINNQRKGFALILELGTCMTKNLIGESHYLRKTHIQLYIPLVTGTHWKIQNLNTRLPFWFYKITWKMLKI